MDHPAWQGLAGEVSSAGGPEASAQDIVARTLSVDLDEARILCDELSWFLRAVESADAPVSPSPSVDRAWHALLADSAVYTHFCKEACGTVIRHLPGPSGDEPYAHARSAIIRMRGYAPEAYWPVVGQAESLPKCGGTTENEDEDEGGG